jgi:Peptidase family M23
MTRPTFRYPFAGSYPVSSPFGPRGGGMHTGTDFAIPTGVEILAANDGQVIYAAYEAGGAGNTVTISGADGWQSRYHHMADWAVSVGQAIRAGELVGWCNNTGASSGPHLHFEIRSNPSTPVDPIPILEADAGSTPGPEPEPPPAPDTESEDTMLIVNKQGGAAAIIHGNHLPQKIPSVNDYHGGVVVALDDGAWQQYFDNAIELHQAAMRD